MTKVFVHGNPETADIWGPLFSALNDLGVNDVVALSPPGFGAPAPDGWDSTPASYVGWLAGELAKIDGPIDIVGHDWGAGHVFGLLAAQPSLVRSWACDCVGLLNPSYEWHEMAQTWQSPDGEEAIAAMASLSVGERVELYVGLGLTEEIATAMAEAASEMGPYILGLYREAKQPMLANLGAALMNANDLPPGLAVDATADAYVGSDLARSVIAKLGAQHLPLVDQGHWWMISQPEQAAAGLASFWASVT